MNEKQKILDESDISLTWLRSRMLCRIKRDRILANIETETNITVARPVAEYVSAAELIDKALGRSDDGDAADQMSAAAVTIIVEALDALGERLKREPAIAVEFKRMAGRRNRAKGRVQAVIRDDVIELTCDDGRTFDLVVEASIAQYVRG